MISFKYGIVDHTSGGLGNASIFPVEGVVALDLNNSNVDHFIDCISDIRPSNLMWEKENTTDPLMFRTRNTDNGSLRLQLSDARAVVGEADLGTYICRDRVTGDSASITLTGGLSTCTKGTLSHEAARWREDMQFLRLWTDGIM